MKAIIFDCFGVLVEGSLEPMCNKFFPHNPELHAEVLKLESRASRGEITYEQFLETCAEWSGADIEEIREYLNDNPRNEPLLEFIASDLKSNYKIGFLSNASDDWMDELFTKEQIALFDDIILSFKHSMAKPDVKIFELAAERLGINTTDCLFVDDVARYCDGARQAGMKVIHYKDVNETIEAIKQEIKT